MLMIIADDAAITPLMMMLMPMLPLPLMPEAAADTPAERGQMLSRRHDTRYYFAAYADDAYADADIFISP